MLQVIWFSLKAAGSFIASKAVGLVGDLVGSRKVRLAALGLVLDWVKRTHPELPLPTPEVIEAGAACLIAGHTLTDCAFLVASALAQRQPGVVANKAVVRQR